MATSSQTIPDDRRQVGELLHHQSRWRVVIAIESSRPAATCWEKARLVNEERLSSTWPLHASFLADVGRAPGEIAR